VEVLRKMVVWNADGRIDAADALQYLTALGDGEVSVATAGKRPFSRRIKVENFRSC